MRSWMAAVPFLLIACAGDDPSKTETTPTTTVQNGAKDTAGFTENIDTTESAANQVVKSPSGIYQFYLPYGEKGIVHTVAFYPGRFRLEEEHTAKKDSVVVTEGTWAPSQGSIWLYKDQIVRGRYSWKGDTLQYFSPRLKQLFSLTKQELAGNNAAWQAKRKEGVSFFSVGTEPFWSVEVDKNDFVTVSMPEWTSPLKLKLKAKAQTKDSTVYTSATGELRMVVYPYFCSDGMSDFIYTSKVRFTYNGQVYEGCGMVF